MAHQIPNQDPRKTLRHTFRQAAIRGVAMLICTGLYSVVFLNNQALAQAEPSDSGDECEFLFQPEQLNTQSAEEGVIQIGRLPDRPYVVIIPNPDDTDLSEVRTCVPDAFLTQARLGQYLQAGSFSRRYEASYLAQTLQNLGFRARVIHRRTLGR
ncbi:MAG: hypothetical protein AAGC54_00585 [Cyanobacteria bacterium P01_F01_bin.4]